MNLKLLSKCVFLGNKFLALVREKYYPKKQAATTFDFYFFRKVLELRIIIYHHGHSASGRKKLSEIFDTYFLDYYFPALGLGQFGKILS